MAGRAPSEKGEDEQMLDSWEEFKLLNVGDEESVPGSNPGPLPQGERPQEKGMMATLEAIITEFEAVVSSRLVVRAPLDFVDETQLALAEILSNSPRRRHAWSVQSFWYDYLSAYISLGVEGISLPPSRPSDDLSPSLPRRSIELLTKAELNGDAHDVDYALRFADQMYGMLRYEAGFGSKSFLLVLKEGELLPSDYRIASVFDDASQDVILSRLVYLEDRVKMLDDKEMDQRHRIGVAENTRDVLVKEKAALGVEKASLLEQNRELAVKLSEYQQKYQTQKRYGRQ